MKKNNPACLAMLAIILVLQSCQPSDPPLPNIFKYERTELGLGTWEECCYAQGNTCNTKDYYNIHFPWLTFRNYIQEGNVKGFFLEEDWERYLPELKDYPAIVEEIIATNPKTIITENNTIVFLKSNTSILNEENTLFAILDVTGHRADPCNRSRN